MSPAPHLLTLLSDFGLQDPYVGVLKGVIATVAPAVTVIDLSHELPPHNLLAAHFCLRSAIPYFPPGTVHVAVVDPGVGSGRRAIALQIESGVLVGPDNGIFSAFLEQVSAAVALDRPEFWRTGSLSATFHGRDLFAPVGAHLAAGVPLAELGTAIDPASLMRLELPPSCVQHIDRFGNLITTLASHEVAGHPWFVCAGGKVIPGGTTYSSVPEGHLLALVGSHGFVEIACNGSSAQQQLGLSWGDPITLKLSQT